MTTTTLTHTLGPLSREHIDGLQFATRIRKGLQLRLPLERLRNYTLWYWSEHIRPHFFQEEKMLMPWLPAGDPLLVRVKDEHHYIRELVLSIDDEAEIRTLALLADLIEDHIEFEESVLFPYLAEILETELVEKIGEMIDKHPLRGTEWKDRFWEE